MFQPLTTPCGYIQPHAVLRPVRTTRKYGPYVRVSKMHPYVRAVHAARTYGPYVRVARIGLEVNRTLVYRFIMCAIVISRALRLAGVNEGLYLSPTRLFT